MLLLGMALFKRGFFSNCLTTQHYVLLTVGCLLVGQIISRFSLSWFTLRYTDMTRYISTNALTTSGVLMPFERAFLAVGWASLVLLCRLGVFSRLWQGLRSVGQIQLRFINPVKNLFRLS